MRAMTDRRARDLAVVAVVILGAAALSAPIQAQQALTPDEIANLRVRAEQGDAEAQSSLGLMYSDGSGVPRNDVEAVRWYRLAADQGFGPAQVNLGVRYADGRGVPQDDAEAVRWYLLAANQGNTVAQYNVGIMYEDGRGVPQDDAEAVRWYRLVADQGYAPAQYNFGLMFDAGRGVRSRCPRRRRSAVRWYRLSPKRFATRGTPPRSTTSESCTKMAEVSPRATWRPTCGSTLALRRSTLRIATNM